MITAKDIEARFAAAISAHRFATFEILATKYPRVGCNEHKGDIWAALVADEEHAVLDFYTRVQTDRDAALAELATTIEQLRREQPLLFVNEPSAGVLLSLRLAEAGLSDAEPKTHGDLLRYLRRELRDGLDASGRRRDFIRLARLLPARDFGRALRNAAKFEEFMAA